MDLRRGVWRVFFGHTNHSLSLVRELSDFRTSDGFYGAKKVLQEQMAKPQNPSNSVGVSPRRRGPGDELYSEEVADEICERLSEGETLISICRVDVHGVPRLRGEFPAYHTVYSWVDPGNTKRFRADFMPRFAEARLNQQRYWVEESIDIANTPDLGYEETVQTGGDKGDITKIVRKDMTEHRKLKIYTRFKAAAMINPEFWSERMKMASIGEGDNERPEIIVRGGLPEN